MPKLKEILGESFNQIPEDIRKKYENIELVDSSNYIPKERFDQVNNDKKEYKKQLDERDKQLNDLQGKVKDNEELTKEIDNLKATNTKTTTEYEEKIKKLQFDTVLNSALKGANAKDAKLIRALLDETKLTVDGENVIGLKEQLDAIKKERDYLFEKEVKGTGSFVSGGGDPTPGNSTNIASELGKQRAETLKAKSLTDFAK